MSAQQEKYLPSYTYEDYLQWEGNSAELFLSGNGKYTRKGELASGNFHFEISGCSIDLNFESVWD